MYLISYADKEGVLYHRLVELQENRDGDLCGIEVAKFKVDEHNSCYKRFKRDKIQSMSVVRELQKHEIDTILGVVLKQTTDNPEPW